MQTKTNLSSNPRADFDGFWKQVIEVYFQPFIELFYPAAAQDIDWNRGFTFLDKELQKLNRGAKAGKYVVDKLVKVYRKNGEEQWVLLHIELQCQYVNDFGQRFYYYHCRIIDGFQVPVASLAILADDNHNWRPNEYWHELWGCKAGISFPMVKLLDYKDKQEELEKHPLGILILAYLQALETQKDSHARYNVKLQLTKSLYQRGLDKETILKLYGFIDWALALPAQLEVKCNEEIKQLEEELNMQHITSAERIGMQKGEIALLSSLLETKFNDIPKIYRERLARANCDTLLKWGKRVLSAQTLEDVFNNTKH